MSRKAKIIGKTAVIVASALVGGGVLVFTQNTGPTDRPNLRSRGTCNHDTIKDAVARALGITVEELETAQEEGKRLNKLAEERGVDLADIEAAIQTTHEEMVRQAVADGTISQEQANQILSGKFRGGHGGRGDNPHPNNRPPVRAAGFPPIAPTMPDM